MTRKFLFTIAIGVMGISSLLAQSNYWQQRVEYTMKIKMNVTNHQFDGDEKLVYYNNSPDTLRKVYYHLYFNAFQPGSMMDVRSRNIPDPDKRVGDRISKLKEDEVGYQHVLSLQQDGRDLTYKVNGTILEVTLTKPLLPKSKSIFEMKFQGQVPVQIRRSGRDNVEGIAYSMTQWYPKIAEYDFEGWHAYEFLARGEFHGVWGDFNVSITIDPNFVIAGTGKLQNADKIGFGYEHAAATVTKGSGDLTWNFIAKDVIDFAWAADPDYTHDRAQVPNGPALHFFYQQNEKTKDTWKNMEPIAAKVFQYLNTHFGKYPFDTYSVIQGGDGGTEYPMCTLVLGEGTLEGLTATVAHEVAHSWFQMTLASNESLHAWMDEGFADFARNEAMASLAPSLYTNPHADSYARYFSMVASGFQEPTNQHSDHFSTLKAYRAAAYTVGAVFLEQLKYLIGEDNFYKGMRRYYNTWKMKHPSPNDFIRVMEKTSGLQLGWYLRYWINTTKHIDYGFGQVTEKDGTTQIELKRIGDLPMPIDMTVTYKDGSKENYYIPMNELLGVKPEEGQRIVCETWSWVSPTYTFKVNRKSSTIASVEIDPSQRMADIDRKNNKLLGDQISN